jgi:DNA-binding NarL/FixJ family response regulator
MPLSPREEQALELIARGFTHAQAARRMGVSKTTVDTYVERIRIKLQVGNKAELTRAAINRAAQAQAATSTIGSGPPGTAR